jgi:hypothetical protein
VELTYSYKWTVRRNNAVVLKEGKRDLSSGTDKIEITGGEPGAHDLLTIPRIQGLKPSEYPRIAARLKPCPDT